MKILGIFIIFSVCAVFGVLKSLSLKERTLALGFYLKGLHSLAERVRADSRELSILLPLCFEERVLFRGNSIVFAGEYLKKTDIALLEEFFTTLGKGDKQSECERIWLFCTLLEKVKHEADAEYRKSGQLYRTIGVLAGLGICIFLI